MSGPRHLWGLDLTLVWVLGLLPVWILGIVDYHGSRLIAFEPVSAASSAEVRRVLRQTFEKHGAPQRLLTDRGPILREQGVEQLLADFGVRHVLTLPAHPWTNGRIERLFSTFRQSVLKLFFLVSSRAQLARLCRDFLVWYNRDRCHGSFDGLTPDEVYFGLPVQRRPVERITYFEGRLSWYRFG